MYALTLQDNVYWNNQLKLYCILVSSSTFCHLQSHWHNTASLVIGYCNGATTALHFQNLLTDYSRCNEMVWGHTCRETRVGKCVEYLPSVPSVEQVTPLHLLMRSSGPVQNTTSVHSSHKGLWSQPLHYHERHNIKPLDCCYWAFLWEFHRMQIW